MLLLAMLAGGPASAADVAAGGKNFGACLAAALETRAGRVLKVEYKLERGSRVYEFNIRSADGTDWDIECAEETAEIVEIEEEVTSVHHPEFAAHARIDERRARELALDAYPGEVVEIEYEIESSGRAVYELDIRTRDGREMKVELDAATGEIVEANEELWQIGYE